jgi:hypothetical protein
LVATNIVPSGENDTSPRLAGTIDGEAILVIVVPEILYSNNPEPMGLLKLAAAGPKSLIANKDPPNKKLAPVGGELLGFVKGTLVKVELVFLRTKEYTAWSVDVPKPPPIKIKLPL